MNLDLMPNKLITIIILAVITILVIFIFIIPIIKLIWGWIKNTFHDKNKDPIKFISDNGIVLLKLERTEKKKIDYINENYSQKSQHTFKGGSNYIVESKNIQHYTKFLDRLLNWDKIIFKIKFKPDLN